MASQKVQVFNDLNFDQEVLKSSLPVLVDFSAEWCGPCKALAPIIEQMATEFAGKLKVGTVDVEESPVTAGKYGVASLPTVLVFKAGLVSAKQVGRTTKAKLTELCEL
jgi:thioredoxin 1